MKEIEKQILAERERKELKEHQQVLLAVAILLKHKEGQQLFKYLFKSFEVMTAPPVGMQGVELHEYLGHLRAGNSIYKLACEADSETAASILAKLERDRYAELYEDHRIEHGTDESDT